MYTLYFAPGSASMVVHLALLEIGLPSRLEKVDLEKGEQRSPAYLGVNPRGQVPTLIVDGRPQYESAALLMLLAERHPEAGLAPAPGEPGRADWYQWVVFMANSLAPPFRYWFMPGDLGSPDGLRSRFSERPIGKFRPCEPVEHRGTPAGWTGDLERA